MPARVVGTTPRTADLNTDTTAPAARDQAQATETRGAAWAGTPANTFGQRLALGGRAAIMERRAKQDEWIEKYGFGAYYGDHSSFQSQNTTERQKTLDEMTKPGVRAPRANQLRQTSCIDWALENVVAAYEKAGRGARGREIASIVISAYTDPSGNTHAKLKGLGGVLCRELKKDGWTSLFWAMDSKNPDSPGSSDREVHRGYVNMAKGQKKYWVAYPHEKMQVDDFVTDFKLSEDSTHAVNMKALERLKKIPFAIGVAKGGMHCFAMHDGMVSENHWTAGPSAKSDEIFQETKLEDWSWSSGLIMVPPGTWRN